MMEQSASDKMGGEVAPPRTRKLSKRIAGYLAGACGIAGLITALIWLGPYGLGHSAWWSDWWVGGTQKYPYITLLIGFGAGLYAVIQKRPIDKAGRWLGTIGLVIFAVMILSGKMLRLVGGPGW